MDIDKKQALDLLTALLRLDGVSGREGRVARFIERRAAAAGVKRAWIRRDTAHRKSPFEGETGNLIITLPGTVKAPRIMFSAHMDTVEIARGSVPVRRGGRIVPRGKTALGADNRSGCAALLHTLVTLMKQRLPHPPVTFLFTVQEEIGLFGARYVARELLGKPRCCYNFDGRKPETLILSAPSAVLFTLTVKGIAAHAGVHPERGVSAATIFAEGLAAVKRKGLFGEIRRGGRKVGTSNLGRVRGGTAFNVVMDKLVAEGEARSYSRSLLRKIVAAYRTCFERAARSTRNEAGRTGLIVFRPREAYTSFDVPRRAPFVKRLGVILGEMGLTPEFTAPFGGLDASWLNAHGIPTVTLGAGEVSPHTTSEELHLPLYFNGCRLALRLATDVPSRQTP